MASVYEGEPDARQSDNRAEPLSRFRPRYRALSPEEKQLHDKIKEAFENAESLVIQLKPGRYRDLAITALEDSCMWSIRGLTS